MISGCASVDDKDGSNGDIQVPEASVELVDADFVRDSEGMPISAMLVADIKIPQGSGSYSCRPTYDNKLIGEVTGEESSQPSYRTTFIPPLEGRLDLEKWGVCCDFKSLSEFTSITSTTFCSSLGGA